MLFPTEQLCVSLPYTLLCHLPHTLFTIIELHFCINNSSKKKKNQNQNFRNSQSFHELRKKIPVHNTNWVILHTFQNKWIFAMTKFFILKLKKNATGKIDIQLKEPDFIWSISLKRLHQFLFVGSFVSRPDRVSYLSANVRNWHG